MILLFGEDISESVRLPSPWDTPKSALSRQGTPSSGAPTDALDSTLSDLSLFDTDPSSLSDVGGAFFVSQAHHGSSDPTTGSSATDSDLAGAALTSQQTRRRTSDLGKAASPSRRLGSLSAESDLSGQVEYKLKLTGVSQDRFNRLTTQLKWRLLEGGGEALYEIGVLDDGTLVGLKRSELVASIKTLERMAEELGATVLVVKEIRLPTLPGGQLDAGDSAGSRRRWEAFQAGLQEHAVSSSASKTKPGLIAPAPASKWVLASGDEVVGGVGKRRFNRDKKWHETAAAAAATSSSTPTSDSSSTPPTPSHLRAHDPHRLPSSASIAVAVKAEPAEDPASSPSSSSRLTDELAPFTKSQSRSAARKKYGSILDDDLSSGGGHKAKAVGGSGDKHSRRPRKHKGAAMAPRHHGHEDDDGCGIFGVFELDLASPFAASTLTLGPPASAPSTVPSHEVSIAVPAKQESKTDVKAAKKLAKKALKATIPHAAADNDNFGWSGESLDVWGADEPPAAGMDRDVTPLSLDEHHLAVLSPSVTPSSPATAAPTTDSGASSSQAASSESLTPSPSPLLVPTYRPPPSLLPRAFPVAQPTTPNLALGPPDALNAADDQDEDGTERLCVEVLVVRKEMENHLNLEDFAARWDVETIRDAEELDDA